MTAEYFISIYLDNRRKKENGKYPVKLRVFTPHPRIQKLYATGLEFTEAEFQSAWETTKPRGEYKELRMRLMALENRALEIAGQLKPFNFQDFERLLNGHKGNSKKNVLFYYDQAIETYTRNNRPGTASNYECSKKSVLGYHGNDRLEFERITPQWLADYEKELVEVEKKSPTTVGIYLRPLRALFNNAIIDKTIFAESYPFGKRKYTIPAPKGVKKALSKDQLKTLFESAPATPDQERAKAFWFFSYACNGMNMKDIANLRFKDVEGDVLIFYRAKTSKTNKSQAPVKAYLNAFTKQVMRDYGNEDQSAENFIFPVLEKNQTKSEQHVKIKNFIRYVNQHFLAYAKAVGVNEKVSSYWARHSFATNAIRSGASMEFVSEALAHSNLNTTRSYFAGFEDEKKKEMARKLMDF